MFAMYVLGTAPVLVALPHETVSITNGVPQADRRPDRASRCGLAGAGGGDSSPSPGVGNLVA